MLARPQSGSGLMMVGVSEFEGDSDLPGSVTVPSPTGSSDLDNDSDAEGKCSSYIGSTDLGACVDVVAKRERRRGPG